MLNKDSKIYVAGHNGLVGRSHKELDLTRLDAVEGVAAKVRTNLTEYFEKGIVK